MRAPTQAELLALWEAGRSLEPLDRGVLAAHAASQGSENIADWPLGRRNRALAQLHCAAFGGVLSGWTRCHGCGEQLEFEFDSHSVANAELEPAERRLVTVGEWLFRLPTSRDLAVAAHETSEPAATRRLLSTCRAGPEPAAADWSEDDVRAIEERLAEADPLAEIRLHFDCPACSASFDESLDLGHFVWAKIESLAKRILRDVHLLASAYGWSESQILALSPARRSAYLEMVLA
jgi:hypothetical protein